MAASDDTRTRIWREVLELSNVHDQESVIVLTSESSIPENVDAAMRAAIALGASTFRLELPPLDATRRGAADRTAFVGLTPLTGNKAALLALKSADFVIDLMGLLHSPEQAEILAAGTRMLMVVEPPEILASMIPTRDDKRRVMAAAAMLGKAKEMRVTSRAGTDMHFPLGQFQPLPEYGYADEPGHWDHWPSGFVSTWPNEGASNGRLVVNVGDMLFPFKRYVETAPIEMTIEEGYIRSIEGGFEATYLRRHLESYGDPDAYAVAHIGWGMQRRARWAALGARDKRQSLGMDGRAAWGNFLFSTGPNAEAGGRNATPCHVDIPMWDCTVALDGVPIVEQGEIVADALRGAE